MSESTGVEEREEHRTGREQRDELPVLVGDRGVDHRAQDQRRHRAHHRGEDHRDDEADQLPPVRAGEAQHASQEVAFEPSCP